MKSGTGFSVVPDLCTHHRSGWIMPVTQMHMLDCLALQISAHALQFSDEGAFFRSNQRRLGWWKPRWRPSWWWLHGCGSLLRQTHVILQQMGAPMSWTFPQTHSRGDTFKWIFCFLSCMCCYVILILQSSPYPPIHCCCRTNPIFCLATDTLKTARTKGHGETLGTASNAVTGLHPPRKCAAVLLHCCASTVMLHCKGKVHIKPQLSLLF